MFPGNCQAFAEYMESMYLSDTLAVNPVARHLAQQVLSGAGSWLRIPSWYRALTAHLLPPRFRAEFGLVYGEREKQSAERTLKWIRKVYDRLPDSVRFVGPYREALAKLQGEGRPRLSVRLSNKLWVGATTLFSPGERNKDHP
jgi:uncharacterized protein (DUF2236 family)